MKYDAVIQASIFYIEKNIGNDLDAASVAEAAGYSYYHFSRLFLKQTGVTLGTYINNRKLAKATDELLQTEERILDISIANGYASSEAFSRVFKKQFSVSPFLYRKNNLGYYLDKRRMLDIGAIEHLKIKAGIVPEIRDIEPIEVVGVVVTASLIENDLDSQWQKFHVENGTSLSDGTLLFDCYGICLDNRAIFQENGDSTMRQMLATSRPIAQKGLPHEYEKMEIKGGKYAIFTHSGSPEKLEASYNYIWGVWNHSKGGIFDATRKSFEFYPQGYPTVQKAMFIYIPIK